MKEKEKEEKFKPEIVKRFRIQFDFAQSSGKESDGSSITVPDMHLTVQQLLEDYTRGRNGKVSVRKPLYLETLIPRIEDITDVEKYREHLANEKQKVEEWLVEEKAKKKEKEEQDLKEKMEAERIQKEKDFEEIARRRGIKFED